VSGASVFPTVIMAAVSSPAPLVRLARNAPMATPGSLHAEEEQGGDGDARRRPDGGDVPVGEGELQAQPRSDQVHNRDGGNERQVRCDGPHRGLTAPVPRRHDRSLPRVPTPGPPATGLRLPAPRSLLRTPHRSSTAAIRTPRRYSRRSCASCWAASIRDQSCTRSAAEGRLIGDPPPLRGQQGFEMIPRKSLNRVRLEPPPPKTR
jgi:hypothetical protein